MGLIGRDISHSKSKTVYESLLNKPVSYELLDYPDSNDIPPLKELLENIPFISITAPYKNFIYKQVDSFPENKYNLESINAIKLIDNKVIGTNTDILAFIKLFTEIKRTYPGDIIILGDGNMGQMIMQYFRAHGINFQNLSRKQRTLDSFGRLYNDEKLIINTCAREYTFNWKINDKALLWDMNYNQEIQKEVCHDNKVNYLDGYSLLIEQAKFALSFWN